MVSKVPCPYTDDYSRTVFQQHHASIQAWPSYGGLIVLDPAYTPDFVFLGLDPLNPRLKSYLVTANQRSTRRSPTDTAAVEVTAAQTKEDEFAQRLLLLGAKWYDSEKRYRILSMMEDIALGLAGQGQAPSEIRVDLVYSLSEAPEPTMREKRVVRVGWPSTGGLWVAEYDTTWGGVDEEDNLGPPSPTHSSTTYENLEEDNDNERDEGGADWARLGLATTMDERCRLLEQQFGAKFYENVAAYNGYAYLGAWGWESIRRKEGEVGPLLTHGQTVKDWFEAYYKRFTLAGRLSRDNNTQYLGNLKERKK